MPWCPGQVRARRSAHTSHLGWVGAEVEADARARHVALALCGARGHAADVGPDALTSLCGGAERGGGDTV